jgi:paraquat-inducible protein A
VTASEWPRLRECPDCGLFSRLPVTEPGTDARCPRCRRILRRVRHSPLTAGLAVTLAGLCFYALTVSTPFLEVDLRGRLQWSTLSSGAAALTQEGLWELGAVVVTTTLMLPLVKLLGTLAVLLGLRMPRPPSRLWAVFRWHETLGPWAMVEVYVLGVLIAYTRLVALAEVHIDVAAYGLVGLMLTLAALDAVLDPEAVWQELGRKGAVPSPTGGQPAHAGDVRPIGCDCCHHVAVGPPGAPCPRCGTSLLHRKPDSLARTWALLGAAAILYVPANYYPVLNITTLGSSGPHTILGGVEELAGAGMWPLALLVFFASITVPVVKLLGLGMMLIATHRRSSWRLFERTRLYRLVDIIGRWSMIDVFMISILVALVRFGAFATITSGVGAVCFAAMVVLTMLAARTFDPRLMWDAAGRASATDSGNGRQRERQ